MAQKRLFITSGTTFTVPADWNSADNTVETLGCGSNGSGTNKAIGGAYSAWFNLALTPGVVLGINVGSPSGASPDTWFGGTSLASCLVGAQGGPNGALASAGTGMVKFSGGRAGSGTAAGAGGAAGPDGDGEDGGVAGAASGAGGDADAGHDGAGGAPGYQSGGSMLLIIGNAGRNGNYWGQGRGFGGGGSGGDGPIGRGGDGGLFGGAGAPAVMHRSGSGVTWNWVQLDLYVGARVKVLFVGDSNMMGNVTATIGRTWPMRFSDRRFEKDMLISAVGSDTGQWINSRQTFDLNSLSRVDFVVFAIGSNYSSQATWRTDVAAAIAAARAKGAEPILCTQIPSASPATALNQAMNADILGGYFGDLRILDIAAVVTTSGDRINWNAAYDNGDHIHINKAGHMAIDKYVNDNAPQLLKDAM